MTTRRKRASSLEPPTSKTTTDWTETEEEDDACEVVPFWVENNLIPTGTIWAIYTIRNHTTLQTNHCHCYCNIQNTIIAHVEELAVTETLRCSYDDYVY